MNPTVVMTPMGKKAWSDPSKAAKLRARIPLDRFAGKTTISSLRSLSKCYFLYIIYTEENEVVKPILFLLSEQSSMVNCVTMPVDGGLVAC